METNLTQLDWMKAKEENEMLIINNKMQIEMAKTVIILCDLKIKEFPEEKVIKPVKS